MRDIKYIVLHCTAGNQKQTIPDIKKFWKSLGWTKNGYHYIITPDGIINLITPLEQTSNGVAGFNSKSIHVCYIGGIDKTGKPIDNRTTFQKASLLDLVKELKSKFPKATILGHRDFSPDTNKNGKIETWEYIKYCPCFDAKEEYKNI